jgi:serine/threonine protein kinase/tetratricopeptide (TPR) repeat protein
MLTPGMGCPDETSLSDLLVGALPAERKAHVLSHVEGCSACQQALAAAGAESGPATGAAPASTRGEAALARGSTVSRYIVIERIGHGAMGVVYAAYDPELDRRVALKLLRPEGRHLEDLRRRLLREAQALARLSHPNVVAVHDVGVCGDDVFLALELVEGTTLADWLKEPRSWREVLRVFRDAGQGLAAAHAAGLVHRDFKPSNILIGRDGRVRVTDFGLARPKNQVELSGELSASWGSPSVQDLSELTQTGALLGTPVYMAPEQFLGQGADELSDQFSFCVALYEGLARVRPFEGLRAEELERAMNEGRVRPPAHDTKLPAWVRRAVLRGLRARPEDRFPSMEALLTALTPRGPRSRAWALAAVPVTVLLGVGVDSALSHRRRLRCEQEVERLASAWSPERRERVRAAFLAIGKPYAGPAWERLSVALDAHASQWRALRTEACLAAGEDTSGLASQTATCLDTRLWQLAAVTDVLEKADVQTVQRAQHLAASLEELTGCRDAPALSTRPQPPDALRPRVDAARRTLAEARARMDANKYAEGVALTSALLQEIRDLGYRPLEAEVFALHGQLQGLDGHPKEAEESLYNALWAAEAGRDDVTLARARLLLLWVVGDQMARTSEAERLARHARAAVERLGQERSPTFATDLHLRLGGVYLAQGRLEQAAEEYLKGLELSRKTHGPDSLTTSYFLSGLGRVRTLQRRDTEALKLYRQIQELRERILGPEHPALALNLSNIAIELLQLGQREEAIAVWQRSLAILETAYPADHTNFAAPLANLATALRSLGRLEEARRNLERALAIFERSKGPEHPHTALTLCELGMVAYDSQQLEEARAYVQDALARVQRAHGAETPHAAMPLVIRGLIHFRAGRQDEARRDLKRALQLWEKEHGPDGPTVTMALRPLALLELSTGAPRTAISHCQRALALDERSQGAVSPDVALDLACLAEAHLALGAPEQAVPLLERARRLHVSAPRDPLDEAWASFLLARALSEQRSGADPARAASLADEARAQLDGLGLRARVELQKVQAWQRRQAPP